MLMAICKENDHYKESVNVVLLNEKVIYYSKHNKSKDMKYEDFGVSVFSKTLLIEFLTNDKSDLSILFSTLASAKRVNAYLCKNKYYEVGSKSGIESTSNKIREKYGIY